MNLHNMRFGWLERSLAGLNRFASKRGQNRIPAQLSVGINGEDAALFYLQRKRYTVVARRCSSGDVPGDVDLIAWHGPMLCLIEVKTAQRTISFPPKSPWMDTSAIACVASRGDICGSFG